MSEHWCAIRIPDVANVPSAARGQLVFRKSRPSTSQAAATGLRLPPTVESVLRSISPRGGVDEVDRLVFSAAELRRERDALATPAHGLHLGQGLRAVDGLSGRIVEDPLGVGEPVADDELQFLLVRRHAAIDDAAAAHRWQEAKCRFVRELDDPRA